MAASAEPTSASWAGLARLSPPLAERLARSTGLEVVQLLDGSPAAAAGIRAGDVLVSLADRPITGVADLQRSLVGDLVGQRVEVTIERDAALHSVQLTPAELRG